MTRVLSRVHFEVGARADDAAAARYRNIERNPLLPYGDTPLGVYRVVGILKSGPDTEFDLESFGGHRVILLEPVSGDAALADANGRFQLLIQAGDLGPSGGLRRLTALCGWPISIWKGSSNRCVKRDL